MLFSEDLRAGSIMTVHFFLLFGFCFTVQVNVKKNSSLPLSSPSKRKKVLTYKLINDGHPKLAKKIIELQTHLAPIFPELDGVALRVRMKRLRRAVAEYDHRTLRIDIDPYHFEPDKKNRLPLVLAHETMHAVQYIDRKFPLGERACDLIMMARLPVEFYPRCMDFYLKIPESLLLLRSQDIKQSALKAINLREAGFRNYIVWFEDELRKISSASHGSLA